MFGGLGIWELLFIFLIVLLLFGAKRLPEIGGSLGKGIREFKESIGGAGEETDREIPAGEESRERRRPEGEPRARERGARSPEERERNAAARDRSPEGPGPGGGREPGDRS